MGKVNRDALRRGAPKLTQDDIEGGDVAVFTVASYEEGTWTEGDEQQHSAFLTFEETGDKRLYLNVTQMDALIERYGDDSDAWIGQPVPVEKVVTTYGTRKYHKVWVVIDTDAWDDIFVEAGVRPKQKKKAAAKRGAKRGRR